MRNFYRDTGIVIKKHRSLKDNRYITILSRESGKIQLIGYGVRSILSKRLSHIETGNYISFSYSKKDDYLTLGETELIWGFSKIKRSEQKMNLLFLLFFVLDRVSAENQIDIELFEKTIKIMTKLNNRDAFALPDLQVYFKEVLLMTGFIDDKVSENPTFNALEFIEGLIDRKIKWAYLEA